MGGTQYSRAPAGRRFKPYPEYKDSGIVWLGKVPSNWVVTALKRIGKLQAGAGFPDEEQGLQSEEIPFFKVGDMGLAANEKVMSDCPNTISKITAIKLRAHIFSPNTIVFAKVGAALLLNRRRLLSRLSCIDNNIMGFIPERCSPSWAFYWLSGLDLGELANPGAVPSVNEGQMNNTPVVVPPPNEQHLVAAFLDSETAKIDALIAKKERLIELLQEKRTALITQAVTKGLDPNVHMKDSGIEWLGQIPAHWDSMALSRLSLTRCDGPFGSGLKSEHYSESGVRVVRLQNIGAGEFYDTDRAYISAEYAAKLGDHNVFSGDLLVAGLGDDAHPVGRACVAPEGIMPAMVKADCFRFRLDIRLMLPRFAAYQLSATATAVAVGLSTGATRSRLNLTTMATRKVILAPLAEQAAILNNLDKSCDEYRAMVAKIREALERLKEYRTALISAAVTGKIDVRGES